MTEPHTHAAPPIDFRALFEQGARHVSSALRRLGVSEADVEDVTHEVLIAANRQLRTYDASRPLRPWLSGFAVRYALRYREQARFRRESPAMEVDAVDAGALPDDRLASAEARAIVTAALAEVPQPLRTVFVMADLDELPMPEIALALDIPLNTGYTRLRLARARFRAAIEALRRRDRSGRLQTVNARVG